jgi:nicotinamide riboside transporter PnuC
MWWSWTLAAIGVTGLYLVTRRNWRGYVLGVGVQALWIVYAVVTTQWGFIASALVYGAVNMIGLVGWRKAERAEHDRK